MYLEVSIYYKTTVFKLNFSSCNTLCLNILKIVYGKRKKVTGIFFIFTLHATLPCTIYFGQVSPFMEKKQQ